MKDQMTRYYAERAKEYDRIYSKPERQKDLKILAAHLKDLLMDRRVLEVACGTGYWTKLIAPCCENVTATDYNEEVLSIAKERLSTQPNILIQQADAFVLESLTNNFNGGLAAFWWSHLQKAQIGEFLMAFNSKLLSGSRVVFTDNNYVEGSSTPIARTDENGNTYQIRKLSNGHDYEILKNFPTEEEFRKYTSQFSDNVNFHSYKYFWCGWYEI